MNLCLCTHPAASHDGYRPGRGDGAGCLAEGCSCENYVAKDANRDNIRAEIRRIELEIRTLNRRLQTVKQQAGL